MDKQLDKYPYKKVLYLQWYEAAIANLILFKCNAASLFSLKIKVYESYILSYF